MEVLLGETSKTATPPASSDIKTGSEKGPATPVVYPPSNHAFMGQKQFAANAESNGQSSRATTTSNAPPMWSPPTPSTMIESSSLTARFRRSTLSPIQRPAWTYRDSPDADEYHAPNSSSRFKPNEVLHWFNPDHPGYQLEKPVIFVAYTPNDSTIALVHGYDGVTKTEHLVPVKMLRRVLGSPIKGRKLQRIFFQGANGDKDNAEDMDTASDAMATSDGPTGMHFGPKSTRQLDPSGSPLAESIECSDIDPNDSSSPSHILSSLAFDDKNPMSIDDDWTLADEKSSGTWKLHPYMGKRIQVMKGVHKGTEGKITSIHSRGWWIIHDDKLKKFKIHSHFCEVIDHVDHEDLRQYHMQRGSKLRKSSSDWKRLNENKKKEDNSDASDDGDSVFVTFGKNPKLHEKKKQKKRSSGEKKKTKARQPIDSDNDSASTDADTEPEHELASTVPDSRLNSISSLKAGRKSKRKESEKVYLPSLTSKPGRRSSRLGSSSILSAMARGSSQGLNTGTDGDESSLRTKEPSTESIPTHDDQVTTKRRRQNRTPMLPSILLVPHNPLEIPQSLRHLNPDTKIEIFNRRTGMVMSGNDAICVKDLPEALLDHAEYEPIIPPPTPELTAERTKNWQGTYREGRSSPGVRVNATVTPQHRVRSSAADGRHVLVKSGPYKGLIGKVEACIPGGWYIISGIADEDILDADVVVRTHDLELLPESNASFEDSFQTQGSPALVPPAGMATPVQPNAQKTDDVKAFENMLYRQFSTPIHALKLRLDALYKEEHTIVEHIARWSTLDKPVEEEIETTQVINQTMTTGALGTTTATSELVGTGNIENGAANASSTHVPTVTANPTQNKMYSDKTSGNHSFASLSLREESKQEENAARMEEHLKRTRAKIAEVEQELDAHIEKADAMRKKAMECFDSVARAT